MLLAQAGYPNGFDMPLIYSIGRAAGFKEATEAVALYLNAIGIRARVQGIDAVQFMEKIKYSWHGKTDAEFVGITPIPVCQYPDPSILLEDGYFSESILSTASSPNLDSLIKAVRNEMNEKKRAELARKAVAIIHDEVYTVPISANKTVYALGKHVDFTPTVRTEFPLMLIKDVRFK
jgi:peptide/nickel transport system substrate-binding protein